MKTHTYIVHAAGSCSLTNPRLYCRLFFIENFYEAPIHNIIYIFYTIVTMEIAM